MKKHYLILLSSIIILILVVININLYIKYNRELDNIKVSYENSVITVSGDFYDNVTACLEDTNNIDINKIVYLKEYIFYMTKALDNLFYIIQTDYSKDLYYLTYSLQAYKSELEQYINAYNSNDTIDSKHYKQVFDDIIKIANWFNKTYTNKNLSNFNSKSFYKDCSDILYLSNMYK